MTGISRTLEPDEAPAVFQALEAYAAAGYDVGFVVYDLATQRGVSYNADQGFFSASTVKAPFAAYVVQSEVDGGGASLDDEMFEDLVMEGTGVMAFDDTSVYALRDVCPTPSSIPTTPATPFCASASTTAGSRRGARRRAWTPVPGRASGIRITARLTWRSCGSTSAST